MKQNRRLFKKISKMNKTSMEVDKTGRRHTLPISGMKQEYYHH